MKKSEIVNHNSTNNSLVHKLIPKADIVYLKIFPNDHLLSVEEQIFFLTLTEGIFGYNEQERNEKLKVLSVDYNVKYLLPFLSTFIKDAIHRNIAYPDLTLLIYSVRMVKSLLNNQYINLAPHLHELLPAIISCSLARKISKYHYDNHWTLRDFSVFVTTAICEKYTNDLNNITNRVIGIYTKPLKNCNMYSLTTLYGAVKGLGSLGDEVIKTFLFPYVYNLGKLLFIIFERPMPSLLFGETNQYILEAKHVKDVILNVMSPVLLKTNNVNDGGTLYSQHFGYLGRFLYIEVKNLESIELKKQNPKMFYNATIDFGSQ